MEEPKYEGMEDKKKVIKISFYELLKSIEAKVNQILIKLNE